LVTCIYIYIYIYICIYIYIYIYIYYIYIYYSWFGYTRLQIFIQVVIKRINRYKDFYMICECLETPKCRKIYSDYTECESFVFKVMLTSKIFLRLSTKSIDQKYFCLQNVWRISVFIKKKDTSLLEIPC